jgi:hypothetical protein
MRVISRLLLMLLVIFSVACSEDDDVSPKKEVFAFKNEQSDKCIAVYGSGAVKKEAYERAYKDIKYVMDKMDEGIKKGLLASKAKIIVVKNEDELEGNINYFKKLLPLESIYTDEEGVDETLPTSTGVGLSNTKLEFMYLCVYYSLLTDSKLTSKFDKLKQAYVEANTKAKIFTPGDAYKDGEKDEIHENASKKNALKYGTYLYNLYKLYFGNGKGKPGEFSITTKDQLKTKNPLGYEFMKNNFE